MHNAAFPVTRQAMRCARRAQIFGSHDREKFAFAAK